MHKFCLKPNLYSKYISKSFLLHGAAMDGEWLSEPIVPKRNSTDFEKELLCHI